MSILADFYNSDVITDPKYKFSPSGVYYAPPRSSYEDYVEFIKVRYKHINFLCIISLVILIQRVYSQKV